MSFQRPATTTVCGRPSTCTVPEPSTLSMPAGRRSRLTRVEPSGERPSTRSRGGTQAVKRAAADATERKRSAGRNIVRTRWCGDRGRRLGPRDDSRASASPNRLMQGSALAEHRVALEVASNPVTPITVGARCLHLPASSLEWTLAAEGRPGHKEESIACEPSRMVRTACGKCGRFRSSSRSGGLGCFRDLSSRMAGCSSPVVMSDAGSMRCRPGGRWQATHCSAAGARMLRPSCPSNHDGARRRPAEPPYNLPFSQP